MNYFSEKKKQAAQTRQERKTYHLLGDLEGLVTQERRAQRCEERRSRDLSNMRMGDSLAVMVLRMSSWGHLRRTGAGRVERRGEQGEQ
jgi:hypothetical protein